MIKNHGEKLVRIRIISYMGDKVSIKLPIDFVKKMIKNNAIDFFNSKADIIDSQKLLTVLMQAFDHDLVGEIAHIERKNGDSIRIIID
ncbi:hypothetical protein [Romboutsia sp.]|uniref:hypothetical protein n=1 Tax=Romboutsia sp. TaxID=1965302 RepID=UPI003F2D5535